MPRYWVIAPFGSADVNLFDKVWQFDLSNDHISIGWPELGDISRLDKPTLQAEVAKTYPASPPATRTLYTNMLWAFHHEIRPGDVVLARRGRKVLAAVGDVTRAGYFAPGQNPVLSDPSNAHSHFLDIRWRDTPRDLQFPSIVFPMHTLMELSEEQFQDLLGGNSKASLIADTPELIADSNSFVLELPRGFHRQQLRQHLQGSVSALYRRTRRGRTAVLHRRWCHRHPCRRTKDRVLRGH